MLNRLDNQKKGWLFWGVVFVTAALVIWFAPEEQTLGGGIRSVYVHVALIWAGMASLAVAGLLGLAVFVGANERLARWMDKIGWVGLAFYAAGVGMSILASKVNWGNVFWQEPRMRVALNMLAMIIIIEIASSWLPWSRLRGLLHAGLVVILAWSTLAAPLVLHPQNPISNSSSTTIQLTFLTLFALCAIAIVWIVWHWRAETNR
jgi:hypothetical protein